MGYANFAEILAALQTMTQKRKVAVVAAQDAHTLEAVLAAAENNLVVPILLGKENEIRKMIGDLGKNSPEPVIMDIEDPLECAQKAVELVQRGEAHCIMKGKIETGSLMKLLVNKESQLTTGRLMSLVAFMEIPHYHKLIAVSDVGLLMYPTLEQKKMLLENAVNALHALGVAKPKVAVLAAVEKVNPQMPETLDAESLKKMNEAGLISGCTVEGPISYDLAINSEAAEIKGYLSPVAGDADLLIVPDIVAGNILAKALVYSGRAKTAGIVVGAKVPIVLTSRSAAAEDKYMSLALAALVGSR
ncbi:bifunctional enoyl-CoA hydratase/phosphate acetyltransferase [Desulfitobacterium chlororespirans]|uniref:Phosphotransacetylase n=1 Tax=Desulfitobacterium chlororespirans DSM 11544 TaxID=1121395 RepID=A0A1M7SXV5_9FIRM|nr:bifunctional enoyl-CoA hydratase/phosphate acetyltransferase [Desulfitobacterium chlororespirans]SHN63302.1 Phosphotransacetylase [Desulfitobacterium chlororespirans DSM 11544]